MGLDRFRLTLLSHMKSGVPLLNSNDGCYTTEEKPENGARVK